MGGGSVMIGTRLGTGPISMVAMKPYSLSVVAAVVECAASAPCNCARCCIPVWTSQESWQII